MTLPRFMRTIVGDPVEVLAQNLNVDGHPLTKVVIRLSNGNGTDSIGYRRADGTHPNGMTSLDLVPYDLDGAATRIQTQIDQPTFSALRTLWVGGHHEEVAKIAVEGTDLNAADMTYYLKGLWG